MKYLFILLLFSTGFYASSYNDSLIYKNGDTMVDEFISMDRGGSGNFGL
jgi:hypothetical protein